MDHGRARYVIGRLAVLLGGVAIACMAATPAAAQPADTPPRYYFRFGILHIAPQVSSSQVELVDVRGAASLALDSGPIAGAGVSVDSETLPAAIIGVVLPWLNHRLAIETILGLPIKMKFHATGTLANQSLAPTVLGIATGIPPLGSDLAEASVLPPVVTVVFRARDFGPVTPVIGGGVAALIAYDERVTNSVLTQVSQPEISIATAFGPVLQAGLDIRLWRGMRARLDIKYIPISTDATIKNIQVMTTIPFVNTVDIGDSKASLSVNPLVAQLAAGFDF